MNAFLMFLLYVVLFVLAATWYSLRITNKTIKGYWWDYITPASAFASGMSCPTSDSVSPSAAQIIFHEQLLLFAVSLVVLRSRVVLTRNKPNTSRGTLSILYFVPPIMAFVMRMSIPSLRE